mmetsp:Transcript_12222/g.34925  ORF Transcript_12222/g.34925 Transcript_12222/m.34925 type:complete len:227 (-) Transcript_12222:768-1448(-)
MAPRSSSPRAHCPASPRVGASSPSCAGAWSPGSSSACSSGTSWAACPRTPSAAGPRSSPPTPGSLLPAAAPALHKALAGCCAPGCSSASSMAWASGHPWPCKWRRRLRDGGPTWSTCSTSPSWWARSSRRHCSWSSCPTCPARRCRPRGDGSWASPSYPRRACFPSLVPSCRSLRTTSSPTAGTRQRSTPCTAWRSSPATRRPWRRWRREVRPTPASRPWSSRRRG